MEIQTTQFTEEIPTFSVDNNFKESAQKDLPTTAEIKAWLVSYLAELLEIKPKEVDVTIPFDRYGLDSSVAVGLIGDLEEWLGAELDPTLMYDYPTIKTLAENLAATVQSDLSNFKKPV